MSTNTLKQWALWRDVGYNWPRSLHLAPRALEDASVDCIQSLVPLKEEGHKDRPEPQSQHGACPSPHLWRGQQRNYAGHNNTNRVEDIDAGRSLVQRCSEAWATNIKPGNQGSSLRSPSSWALNPAACRMTFFGH